MAKPPPPVLLWHWRLRNATKRGGWEVLHWAMTEADAAQWARHNGVELQKVEGSREERQDFSGKPAMSRPLRQCPVKIKT